MHAKNECMHTIILVTKTDRDLNICVSIACSVMSDVERVDVTILMDILPPMIPPPGSIDMYRIYVDTTPLSNVQAQPETGVQSLMVSWHIEYYIHQSNQ